MIIKIIKFNRNIVINKIIIIEKFFANYIIKYKNENIK